MGLRGAGQAGAGHGGEADVETTAKLVATCTAAATAAVLKAASLQVSTWVHVTCMLLYIACMSHACCMHRNVRYCAMVCGYSFMGTLSLHA